MPSHVSSLLTYYKEAFERENIHGAKHSNNTNNGGNKSVYVLLVATRFWSLLLTTEYELYQFIINIAEQIF